MPAHDPKTGQFVSAGASSASPAAAAAEGASSSSATPILTAPPELELTAPAPAAVPLLKTPNITPAQYLGMVPLLLEAAHTFGVFTLSQAQQDSLTKLVAGGLALFGADAVVRFGRAVGNAVRTKT